MTEKKERKAWGRRQVEVKEEKEQGDDEDEVDDDKGECRRKAMRTWRSSGARAPEEENLSCRNLLGKY